MLRTLLVVGVMIVSFAACTAAPDGSAAPGAGGVSLQPDITDPIVADAATRLGVETSAVTILDAHAETWPDGSLGCPQPGMMYTQALVEGYQVIVEGNGTQLDYRGVGPGQFQLCEHP